jgi:hypothetical protein
MKTLSINIPEIGKKVGTTAWVAERLEAVNKSLETSEVYGVPCLQYRDEFRKGGKPTVLCFVYDGTYDYNHGVGYNLLHLNGLEDVLVIKSNSGEFWTGMFNYLTPLAKEIVDEYIEKVSIEFMKQLATL